MKRLDDENKYENVTKLLKSLSKVNAPSNLETELKRIINQDEEKKEKISWYDKIFSPQLVPSAALAATAVIIIFLLRGSVDVAEDPFRVMPKLREEKIVAVEEPVVSQEKSEIVKSPKVLKKDKSTGRIMDKLQSEKPVQKNELDVAAAPAKEEESMVRISITETNDVPEQKIIMGGGLNYRMINPDTNERKLVEMLRVKSDTLAKSQQIK